MMTLSVLAACTGGSSSTTSPAATVDLGGTTTTVPTTTTAVAATPVPEPGAAVNRLVVVRCGREHPHHRPRWVAALTNHR